MRLRRPSAAEAGYAGGFDAREYNIGSSYSNFGEAVLDNLQAIGIRATSDQRLNRAKSLGSTPSISAITMVGISAALPFYSVKEFGYSFSR